MGPPRSRVQRLKAKDRFDIGWDIYKPYTDLIQLVDLNSDGYLDLRLLHASGATGNNWYATYLFDKKTNKFRYHSELSNLSGLRYDKKSGLIKTYERCGWCAEFIGHYKMIDDKLILLKAQWTQIDRRRDDEVGDRNASSIQGYQVQKMLKSIHMYFCAHMTLLIILK